MNRRYCIVCEKEIYRANGVRRVATRRRPEDITCSRECSRVYGRVVSHVRSFIKNEKD